MVLQLRAAFASICLISDGQARATRVRPKAATTAPHVQPATAASVFSDHIDPAVFHLDVPILGICYGCQELTWMTETSNDAGGTIRDDGRADVNIHNNGNAYMDSLFKRLVDSMHVKESFEHQPGIKLIVVNGSELFLSRLKGVHKPGKKRYITQRAQRHDQDIPQRQRTAGVSQAETHRASARDFKDGIRKFSHELGIHRDLVIRRPFPRPAIAICILGEITPEQVHIAPAADRIFISGIRNAGVNDEMSQAYVAISKDRRAVSVQSDARAYGHIAVLRVVEMRAAARAELGDWGIYRLRREVDLIRPMRP
ncbi:uncharacterized protein B0I36DRAFT_429425 [Microdochium trichocladiopsis]|uniref:GMP synthase C-terminal domain-containing protein n=1 Tax=Microdochium trichocladiopsis TaxID=1682393 RepID=A0A9P9BSW1_9PEZI|nr:uncharacterized protein B0I36DRAFT_429425 [Microdochium trichocladiopsis]KAH7035265.1 hypothetical protein B0I36DRAFT_429425 [Microdochium trichocladiopsis]